MLCECGHDVDSDFAIPITSGEALIELRLVKGNRPVRRIIRQVDPPPLYICPACLFPDGRPPGAA